MLYQLSYARDFISRRAGPEGCAVALRPIPGVDSMQRAKMRSRTRTWLRFLALPGFFVLLSLVFARTELASRLAARFLEGTLEPLLGEDVTVAGIALSYWPVEASVVGLVITHRPTGDTIVAAPTITGTVGFAGLRPALLRLTLDRPRVELHLDPDGLREFRNTVQQPGKGDPPRRFPWEELVIRDGSFALHTEGLDLGVDGIRLAGSPDATLDLGLVSVRAGEIEQVARDVHFPGLRLTPHSLDLPSIALAFPAMTVEGHATADLQADLAGDLSIHLDAGRLTGGPGRTSWTDGQVDVDATLGGTPTRPEVGGRFVVRGFTLWQDNEGQPEPVRFGDVDGAWALDRADPVSIVVEDGRMAWGEGTLGIAARIGLAEPTIVGGVTAESVRLARILQSVSVAPTPWVDFRADIETHVTGTYAPFLLRGPFEVDLSELRVGDAPIDGPHDTLLAVPWGNVGGEMTITADHLLLDARQVRAGRTRGRALADIGFGHDGPLLVDVDLPTLDLSWLQPLGDLGLAGIGALRGRLAGPYDHLLAEGHLEADGAVILGFPLADHLSADLGSDMQRLWFTAVQGTLGQTHYDGSYAIDFTRDNWMDTQVRVVDGRIADLTGVFVDLAGLDGAATGSLSLTGTPYALSGDAAFTLADVDLYGEHFPSGRAVGWMDDGEFTLGELSLTRGDDLVRARGSVKRGFSMNMEVLTDGIRLEDLDTLTDLDLPLRGNLRLDARVGGTLFDWEPRGRIAATAVHYLGEPVADSQVDFSTSGGVLSWRGGLLGQSAEVDGHLAFGGDQPYALHADFAGFPLHTVYPRAADGSRVDARLSGTLDLGGRFGDSPTPVDIEGRFDVVKARWGEHTLANPAPWVFSVHDRNVDIPGLALVGEDGTALQFEGWAGSGGRISLRADGTVNLDLARVFVPGLTEARGMATVGFDYTQAPGQPARVKGALNLDGATLRTVYFPHPIEDLHADLLATPDGYRVENLTAQVGGGTLSSTLSTIEAEGWLPRRYALDASLRDARVQYLDYLPPLVGDADLAFDGPVGDLLLSGDIRVEDMEFRDRIDWEAMVISFSEETLTAAAAEETEKYFSMDLHVVADDTVKLRNNVADADASADLRIIGDTARPGMTGDIRVEGGGRMYLHEREFDISRAELRYIDPYTFDPDLDILLETDVRSHDQDYHVNYSVTGPFSDWRSTTSSDPALSQADVNALLLFGYTREELERYGGLQAALVAETGDLLFGQTAFLQKNPFLSTIVDRWSLVSGVSERGSSTVSSNLRLVAEKEVEGFDLTLETTVSGGFGRDYYVSVERRIIERMYATAYLATQQEGRSLPIGAAYGAEFKLRWEWN